MSVSQPSQDMPHRVFGTVETVQGDPVSDEQVRIVYDGDRIVSDSTDSDGYYDIQVPVGDKYSGDEIDISVRDEIRGSIDFESGKISEEDIVIEDSDETQESSGGAPSGGLPQQDYNQNETSEYNVSDNESEANATEDLDDNINDDSSEESSDDEASEEDTFERDNSEGSESTNRNKITVGVDETDSSGSVRSLSFNSDSKDKSEVDVKEFDADNFSEASGEDIELPNDSQTYKVIQINTDSETSNASIEFDVEKSYLEEKDAAKSDVVQQRYSNGEWNRLDTRLMSETEKEYVYEASSPEGFSNFAITIDDKEEILTGNFFADNSSVISVLVVSIVAIISIIYYRKNGDGESMRGLEEFT